MIFRALGAAAKLLSSKSVLPCCFKNKTQQKTHISTKAAISTRVIPWFRKRTWKLSPHPLLGGFKAETPSSTTAEAVSDHCSSGHKSYSPSDTRAWFSSSHFGRVIGAARHISSLRFGDLILPLLPLRISRQVLFGWTPANFKIPSPLLQMG